MDIDGVGAAQPPSDGFEPVATPAESAAPRDARTALLDHLAMAEALDLPVPDFHTFTCALDALDLEYDWGDWQEPPYGLLLTMRRLHLAPGCDVDFTLWCFTYDDEFCPQPDRPERPVETRILAAIAWGLAHPDLWQPTFIQDRKPPGAFW